jgi:predicted porin
VAVGLSQQDTNAAGTLEYKTLNFAGSWNFGFARLMAQLSNEKNELAAPTAAQKERRWLIGVVAPLGQGELRASYVRSDASGGVAGFSANDANQIAVGYAYNLSKRTALYATASRITNKGTQAFAIPSGPALTPGGESQAVEAGLRHAF